MDALGASLRGSPDIAAELQLAENQYSFLQDAARRPRVGGEDHNILEVLERVAKSCEAAAA